MEEDSFQIYKSFREFHCPWGPWGAFPRRAFLPEGKLGRDISPEWRTDGKLRDIHEGLCIFFDRAPQISVPPWTVVLRGMAKRETHLQPLGAWDHLRDTMLLSGHEVEEAGGRAGRRLSAPVFWACGRGTATACSFQLSYLSLRTWHLSHQAFFHETALT